MPAPLPIQSAHHIGRVVRDLDASIAFYRDVLGFEQVWRPDFDFRGAWLFNYGLQVHLICVNPDASVEPIPISGRNDHIAFYVEDTDQVEALLHEHQIAFHKSTVANTGVTQLFFLDPDNNHIEVGTYPPTRFLDVE